MHIAYQIVYNLIYQNTLSFSNTAIAPILLQPVTAPSVQALSVRRIYSLLSTWEASEFKSCPANIVIQYGFRPVTRESDMIDGKDLLDQKLAEREQLEKEIDKLRTQQRKQTITAMKADIKRFDISPEEIFPSTQPVRKAKAATPGKAARKKTGKVARKKSSPVSPKYRDPDTGKTWSGRGREPLWLRGKNRDDYLIADNSH